MVGDGYIAIQSYARGNRPMLMQLVKGRRSNVVSVGWENGILHVNLRSGLRIFEDVPKIIKYKLVGTPYPDLTWPQMIKKYHLYDHEITPQAKPDIDFTSIPF
jgi:hypothetical protein